MFGHAIRCEQCGEINFCSPEEVEDEGVPVTWFRLSEYTPPETGSRKTHKERHFCGTQCAIKYLQERV